MQRKTLKIVVYSQVGHHEYPEDTWDEQHIWEDDLDILSFMQTMFVKDARNFTSPEYGYYFDVKCISFITQNIIIDELNETFYGDEREASAPESFPAICEEFKTWATEYVITHIKREKEKRIKDRKEEELAMLAKLKAKYELGKEE